MLKIFKFALFLIILKFYVTDNFDPTKIDYCKVKCIKPDSEMVSTACDCEPGNDRTYVTDNMQEFRQLIVDTHNEQRNKIARGDEEKVNGYEPAANMHIFKYDLELEHLARCYVMRKTFVHGHDPCRQVTFCDSSSAPGQNIGGYSFPTWNNSKIQWTVERWYGELTNIPMERRKEIINKFEANLPYGAGHFTQLIWADHRKVGCARSIIPNNTYKTYKFVLMCNYAARKEHCGGNKVGWPVYLAGKPCSQCGDTKCNKDLGGKYDALCGEDVKAPADAPAVILVKYPVEASSKTPGEAVSEVPGVTPGEAPDETPTEALDETPTEVPSEANSTENEKGDGSMNFVNKFFIVYIVILKLTLGIKNEIK